MGLVAVVVLALGLWWWDGRQEEPDVLWEPTFSSGHSLVTNEYAYRNPHARDARRSQDWVVTSGSLFAFDGAGWTGPVDGDSPGPASSDATGSAVLRAVSARDDFGDVKVSLALDVGRFTTTERTGEESYDGVHIFLRYTSPESLYAVTVCRRDGLAVVKRKEPRGDSDEGVYTTLAELRMPCAVRKWQQYAVTVRDVDEGVRITLAAGDRTVLSVLDNGYGGEAPLRGAGRVGVRGDNTDFRFRDLTVRAAP